MALLVEALRNPAYSGVYNGTAPNPVRMSELCSSLGAALNFLPTRPCFNAAAGYLLLLCYEHHAATYYQIWCSVQHAAVAVSTLSGCCILPALQQRRQYSLEAVYSGVAGSAGPAGADHGSRS